ncbi:DUF4157 domain-containing protein (plasmid) [Acaryochloris sp. 'Moss Beach']|uniref:eCIS core domain-containing protein n=1 Tax=Acaryochloris sp. 'Moss Beach' TaxID=2740837 RepID=UPI001F3CC8A9|nr:DUF4157 domain-containing protein [Acaryochloris sp. 'Moss Beach']UJB72939.1 DUF4157 domain-containing protein [Acaryochloris sp. 'Moss Beach']
MGSYQRTTKQNAAQSSQQHAPPTVVPQPPQVQQQTIQAKSNEEGLAEHAERLRKFQRLGNSMMQMGPPRFDNDKTSPLQLTPLVQKKMAIGEPGGKYEQEADRVAFQVVQTINAPTSIEKNNLRQSIQREKDLEGVMCARGFQAAIQRKQAITGGEASPDLESAINSARGGGQPLDAELQQSMGQAMGADFSEVKVHMDAQSDQLNQSIQARAFTTGQDVFFRKGAYQPGSREGQELIAHELTHVVQQETTSSKKEITKFQDDHAAFRKEIANNSMEIAKGIWPKRGSRMSLSYIQRRIHKWDGSAWTPGKKNREGSKPFPKEVMGEAIYFNDVTGKTGETEKSASEELKELAMKPGSLSENEELGGQEWEKLAATLEAELNPKKFD